MEVCPKLDTRQATLIFEDKPKMVSHIRTIIGFKHSVQFWAERNFAFNAVTIID